MANVEALKSEETEYGEFSPCYVGAEQYACVAFATGLIEVAIHVANAEGESKGIDLKSYMGYDQYIAEGKGTLRGINYKMTNGDNSERTFVECKGPEGHKDPIFY